MRDLKLQRQCGKNRSGNRDKTWVKNLLISPWKRAWRKHKHKHKDQNILIFLLALMLASHVKTKHNTSARKKQWFWRTFWAKQRLIQKIILRKLFVSYCGYFSCLDSPKKLKNVAAVKIVRVFSHLVYVFHQSNAQKPVFNNDQIFAGEYFVLVLALVFVFTCA